MDLKNRIAVVTGASRGIGREVSIELAREGCQLILVGRDLDELTKTQQLVAEAGGISEVSAVDLRNVSDLNNFTSLVENKYSTVDVLCNVAGIYHSDNQSFFDIDFENFSTDAVADSLQVGIQASMLLSKAFIPLMKNEGRIINTSGTFGKGEKDGTFEKGCLPDFVTKKAIEVFTKQLAYELEDKNITVNAIQPWFVWTENVQKFFPETKDEAIPVNKVARAYVDLLKSDKTGQIVEIRN